MSRDAGGELFGTKEDAIQSAIEWADIGDVIHICRGEPAECPDGETCPMCARVVVTVGMTALDALHLAKAARA